MRMSSALIFWIHKRVISHERYFYSESCEKRELERKFFLRKSSAGKQEKNEQKNHSL
jgi:hypothetical protein